MFVSRICLCGDWVPMPSWVSQWKPFWTRVGETNKKAFLEEWIFVGDDSADEQNVTDFPVFIHLFILHSTGHTDYIGDDHPPTPRPSRQPDSLPWEPTRPQDKAYSWERIEAPLHHCLLHGHGPNATSFIQDSSVPFLNAWNCPFQMMKSFQATKILSPQEQINLLRGSR